VRLETFGQFHESHDGGMCPQPTEIIAESLVIPTVESLLAALSHRPFA